MGYSFVPRVRGLRPPHLGCAERGVRPRPVQRDLLHRHRRHAQRLARTRILALRRRRHGRLRRRLLQGRGRNTTGRPAGGRPSPGTPAARAEPVPPLRPRVPARTRNSRAFRRRSPCGASPAGGLHPASSGREPDGRGRLSFRDRSRIRGPADNCGGGGGMPPPPALAPRRTPFSVFSCPPQGWVWIQPLVLVGSSSEAVAPRRLPHRRRRAPASRCVSVETGWRGPAPGTGPAPGHRSSHQEGS